MFGRASLATLDRFSIEERQSLNDFMDGWSTDVLVGTTRVTSPPQDNLRVRERLSYCWQELFMFPFLFLFMYAL